MRLEHQMRSIERVPERDEIRESVCDLGDISTELVIRL